MNMDFEKILSVAITIGEKMLCSGAEVGRVEDTVARICRAYNAKEINVFTITSLMTVTVEFEGKTYTQTRRVSAYDNTNFELLDRLNALSREICANKPEPEEITKRLDKLLSLKPYRLWVQVLAWSAIAGAFTIFFGGCFTDFFVSAVVGALLKLSQLFVGKMGINKVFSNVICSYIMCSLAYLSVKLGLGVSADNIIIGNVMLLIPGIALTNSVRDLISRDIAAGALRLLDAALVSIAIAGGYALTLLTFGGVL